MLPSLPDEPIVSQIYRGFLLELPPTVTTSDVQTVEYQYRQSPDNSLWEDWATLGIVGLPAQYRFIHDNLYVSVYYQYRMRLTGYNGTVTDWSDYAMPGNGGVKLQDFPVNQADRLASSLGTVSYGYMRGVVFETSPNYPKVRFDPNGFYAINNNATPLFIDAFTGNITVKGGTITGARIATSNASSQIVMQSNGFYAYDTSTPSAPSTPIQFNPTIGLYQFGGHVAAQGVDFYVTFSSAQTAPDENKVRWLTSAGAKQAEIAGGVSSDGGGSLYLTTTGTAAPNSQASIYMANRTIQVVAGGQPTAQPGVLLGDGGATDWQPQVYSNGYYDHPNFNAYTTLFNVAPGYRKVEWSITAFMQGAAAPGLVSVRLDIDGNYVPFSYGDSEIIFFFNQLGVHCFMGIKTFWYDFGSVRTSHSFVPRWIYGSGQTTDNNDYIMIRIY